MTVGILGGGLAGLAVAAHLGHDSEILEADARPGGHCLTVQEDGFTFDAGGPHIMFSRNEETLALMVGLLGDNVHRGRRANKIFFKGRYVKYPFENGLYDLEPQDRATPAHITGRAVVPGTEYLPVFRLAGTVAFAGYSLALWQMSIWYSRPLSLTLKATIDGLLYALLTAGVFGWLWPK